MTAAHFPQALTRRLEALSWLAANFWAPKKGALLLMAALTLTSSVLAGLLPRATQRVVDHASGGGVMSIWLVVMVASIALVPVIETVTTIVGAGVERALTVATDRQLIDWGRSMPDLAVLDSRKGRGELWQQLTGLAWMCRMHNFVMAALGSVVSVGIIVWSLAQLAWFVGPLLLVVVIPQIVVEYRSHDIRYNAEVTNSVANREAAYSLRAATEPSLAREVRVFGLADWFLRRHEYWAGQASRTTLKASWTIATRAIGVGMVYAIAIAGCLWLGGQRSTTPGEVMLLVTASMSAAGVASGVAPVWSMMWQTTDTVLDMREFRREATPRIDIAVPGVMSPHHWQTGLRLTGVRFGYDPDRPVIEGLDLQVPAGKVLALVGENGEGKSTLVRLLTRMNDPQAGEITLDGRRLAEFNLSSYRAGIATVFQDHARFAMSAAENIAIGDQSLIDQASSASLRGRIERAAEQGGASTVLDGLADGLDTELTREFGGEELSGGEWQRVATARAFFPDSRLIILDEPTSAIDVDSERRLFDRFAELVKGKTAVMISHRFSTVRTADVIAVLAGGRVAEYGSHDELMALGGRYRELFSAQADRYRD